MAKYKKRRKEFEKDVVTTNRWGCGIVIVLLVGMILAMIFAGATQ
ncbi:MAG: hypothetical protein ACE5F7_01035 [Nitrospiria bacterium]